MAKVRSGDTVKVHYVGTLEDGTIIDTSDKGKPFEFTLGSGVVVPGVEQAIIGMEEGESKSFTVPPELAYGPHYADAIVEMPRSHLPKGLSLKPGMTFRGQSAKGPVNFKLISVDGDTAKMDTNHIYAGKSLHFDLKVVAITSSAK